MTLTPMNHFINGCCSEIEHNVAIVQRNCHGDEFLTNDEVMTHLMTVIRLANAALSALHKQESLVRNTNANHA